MTTFERADGTPLSIVPGFRDSVLHARPSGTPKDSWTDADYAVSARKRLAQAERRWAQIAAALGGEQLPQHGLEIGCGAGVDCVLAALAGMTDVVGVDHDPPLLATDDQRARALRLVEAAASLAGADEDARVLLERLPVRILSMDATALPLEDASMDVVWSRTAFEHVQPLDRALLETARVLRPGGVGHHVIDPFFWLKGCHARGLTEMPWAHARLDRADYERLVAAVESRGRAAKRGAYVRTLNQLTIDDWREAIESTEAFDVIAWDEHHSPIAQGMLARHPDVVDTRLPGVTVGDLTCSAITAVLRRR